MTTEDLQRKLDILRKEWKTAKESDRKIIELRAKLLKIALLDKPLL